MTRSLGPTRVMTAVRHPAERAGRPPALRT